jgi:vibriolysin
MTVIDQFDFFGMEIELHANSSAIDAHPRTQINLFGGEWRLLGGGAVVEPHAGTGNFLTAMYPISSTEWDARAKDHINGSPAQITAYGAAARVRGRPIPADAYQIIEASSPAPANHPRAEAFLPADFVLVGGGARVNWESTGGVGNILTTSRPGIGQSWVAAGKDHLQPNPATITAYAIGLRKTLLDQLGLAVVRFRAHTIDPSAMPKVSCGTDEGSALLVAGGAETHWSGAGSLLTASGFSPAAGGPRPWSWIAHGKDHINPDPGQITAWALALVKHQ